MPKKKRPFLKKSAPLWAILVVVILCSGSAAALVIYSLGVENISIWGGEVQDSRFTITTLATKIKGPNRIDIALTVKNTDTLTHSADVAVNLLYENGDHITSATQTIENVPGEDTMALTLEFRQNGLTAAFDRSFIVVKDID